jgi:hypothetical protein
MTGNGIFQTLRSLNKLCFLAALGGGLIAPTVVAQDAPSCSANTDVRQLDFWLGKWEITNPSGSGGGKSNVYLALDKCLFIESWDNGKGHAGENLFAYSPDDKTWHGMFADNQSHVHVFTDGTVASGSAEFHGLNRGPSGETVLNRMKVTRISADKVKQTWEKSSDNGATWKTVFQGEYSRTDR